MKRTTRKQPPIRVAILGEWLTMNRSTGQAYLNVHDPRRGAKVRRYFGRFHGPDGELNVETVERAQRWLTERVTSGGAPLHPEREGELTVGEVADAFLAERESFASEKEVNHYAKAFEPLRALYGTLPAREFGPLALRAVRERMIASGRLNRPVTNNRTDRIRKLFQWAAGLEMVPANVHDALRCVEHVQRGRVEGLRERKRVLPVSDEQVEAILPHVSPQVAAIVRLMQATGMRCGEVVQLRPCDVDRSREPWVYAPRAHKNEHRGHARKVWLGPQARSVLRAWLLRGASAPCFVPSEAEADRRAALAESRTTPLSEGNRAGYSERVRDGRDALREPGETYTTCSVRRSIHRACDRAQVARWSPHQLRHSAATRYQHGAGWEEARLLLGHRSVDVTQQYAERDEATAAAAAERLG